MDAHLFEELLASVNEMGAILKGKAEPGQKTLIASELDVPVAVGRPLEF